MYLLALLALFAGPPTDRQGLRTLPRLVSVPQVVTSGWDDVVIVKNEIAPRRWECVVSARLLVNVPWLKVAFSLPVTHRVIFHPQIAGSGAPLGYS